MLRGITPTLNDQLLIEKNIEDGFNIGKNLKTEQYLLYYNDQLKEAKSVEAYFQQIT